MRSVAAIFALLAGAGMLALPGAALAAQSSAVTVGSAGGTVIVNGRPCRVVHRGNAPNSAATSSTSITAGGGLGGTATAGPNGTSVTLSPPGSGGGSVAVGSAAGGSGCVVVAPSGH